jgi:hypothetical protein
MIFPAKQHNGSEPPRRGSMTTVLVLFSLLIALATACGGDGSNANVITYRLVEASGPFDSSGSLIAFASSLLGIPPMAPEPLQGTFDAVRIDPLPPNTMFSFLITRLDLRSASYAIVGDSGAITATTLNPDQPLEAVATVTINGQPIELRGDGTARTFAGDPPTLQGLVMIGTPGSGDGTYGVTIFATPDG